MKKIEEKKLFDLIYPQFQMVEVKDDDPPDFICHIDDVPVLGVEVTEVFRNEGHARLQKKPEYTLQLIDKKAYMHKDDKEFLRVEKIQITSPEGIVANDIQCLFDPGISAKEAVSCINSAIKKKCKKTPAYLNKVPEVDLIIHDAAQLFVTERETIFLAISQFLAPFAISSPFREIFLLIPMQDGSIFRLPLKFSLFLEDVFIFEKLIREDLTLQKKNAYDKFEILFYCLTQKGYGTFKTLIETGEITIFAGSHKCVYSTTKGKHLNWTPYNAHDANTPYETIFDSISDIDDHLVEIGQGYLAVRKNMAWFVDVFSKQDQTT